LDLHGASLTGLRLSGTTVVAELQLSKDGKSVVWNHKNGKPATLDLRNAHVTYLADAEDAWPDKNDDPGNLLVHLNGFTFDHLGSSEEDTKLDARDGGITWWDKNWVQLDPFFSSSPYVQLANAFTAMGDRNSANEIRYLGRERDREEAWNHQRWSTWL
jgi:hypothetical protein